MGYHVFLFAIYHADENVAKRVTVIDKQQLHGRQYGKFIVLVMEPLLGGRGSLHQQ